MRICYSSVSQLRQCPLADCWMETALKSWGSAWLHRRAPWSQLLFPSQPCAREAGCFHALGGTHLKNCSPQLALHLALLYHLPSSLTLSGEPIQGAPAIHHLSSETPGALARGLQLCCHLCPQLQWSSSRDWVSAEAAQIPYHQDREERRRVRYVTVPI